MGQGAADRAPVANLGVADETGHMGQDRHLGLHQVAVLDVMVAGQRPDGDVIAAVADVGQVTDPGDVDEDGRRRQPELHERDQRVATGQQLGVLAVLGQQADGLLGRPCSDVVERRRDHRAPPFAS